MSRVPSRSARRAPSRHAAPSPAVAGFRPAQAALAIAAAFSLQPALLQAQPSGGQAIHGQAGFSISGNNLVVTTQNGAGTSHSAINWQSFSVPGGSTTHFAQPSANSTSINRVIGPDPSAIYGTLSSNGKLVLVNPAGITVGAGAIVDTAGFTASTLRMSDADAIAGRLLFQGDGAGVLQVDGRIIARSGDVVLIGSKVQTGAPALMESDGSTTLAAGQKVEITGRGLEGIRMEVQAGNEAVNLGTLKGDAVGIFAGTLRHSGMVQAQGVSAEGGKVVLKAGGDAIVAGQVRALRADGVGGRIDVLGQQVALLAGAKLDASGPNGGGQVRVGGDFQGKNPDVPNAMRTYVDGAASIHADATVRGNGGRVIVWADEVTRMHGRISARGGAEGGNGGFAEVSGKQFLDFNGRVDLRAPRGAAGTLLLDPEDITIVSSTDVNENIMSSGTPPDFQFTSTGGPSKLRDTTLVSQLELGNVVVTTDTGPSGTGGQITVNADANVTWTNASDLTLLADKGITVNGTLHNSTDAGSAITLTAKGGNIDVNAGANIYAGAVTLQTTGANTDVNIDGASISARQALTIQATRNVDFGSSTGIYPGTASVTVTAGGNIAGQVTVFTSGSADPLASALRFDAGGDISFNAITTGTGTYSGLHGGKVTLTAGGNITGNTIAANGSNAYDFEAGHGGDVTVTSTGGFIAIDTISARGGATSEPLATPAPAGNAGHGGAVVLSGKTGVQVSQIDASGGASIGTNFPPASGGDAGSVTVIAETGDLELGSVNVNGGSGSTAKDGGSATIKALGGNVTLGSLVSVGGVAYGTGTSGTGGTVKVQAGGDIMLTSGETAAISADGGSADRGTGGQGGSVELKMGGNFVVEFSGDAVSVTGGQGGNTESSGATAGAGGNGGSITIHRTGGGSLVLDSTVTVAAGGGDGGTASGTDGTGGAGGNGGTIALFSDGGPVVLRSPDLDATGGNGGSGNTSYGASGAQGKLTAMGSSVEVESSLDLKAVWENSSNVNIRNASAVYGMGTFRNMGSGSHVNLYDTALLIPVGGVENKGRITSFGVNAVDVTQNLGLLEVAAGGWLSTPVFANEGTVKVDGTLEAGSSPSLLIDCVGECLLAAAPEDTFTNLAGGVITGNGTLVVSGGLGVVDNYGTIAPGGEGTVGTLTLDGSLVMQPGSSIATDLASTTSFDVLKVTGSVTTGGSYAINYLPGASFGTGTSFRVLESGALDATTLPSVSVPELSAAASGNDLLLVAGKDFPSVPPPAAPQEEQAAQQMNNQVVTFAELFIEEAEKQDEEKRIGRDDIVVTDTSCKPS